jgi:hypothetical protein
MFLIHAHQRKLADKISSSRMGEARQLGKTNFKIKCGTWIWGVHKEVLSANSSYLESTFAAQEEVRHSVQS